MLYIPETRSSSRALRRLLGWLKSHGRPSCGSVTVRSSANPGATCFHPPFTISFVMRGGSRSPRSSFWPLACALGHVYALPRAAREAVLPRSRLGLAVGTLLTPRPCRRRRRLCPRGLRSWPRLLLHRVWWGRLRSGWEWRVAPRWGCRGVSKRSRLFVQKSSIGWLAMGALLLLHLLQGLWARSWYVSSSFVVGLLLLLRAGGALGACCVQSRLQAPVAHHERPTRPSVATSMLV